MLNQRDQASLKKLNDWEKAYLDKGDNNQAKYIINKAGEVMKPVADPIAKWIRPVAEGKTVVLIQKAIHESILGALQFTQDNVKYTYSKDYILKCLDISSSEYLVGFDADNIEFYVNKVISQNKIAGALEGFGFGLGGVETTLMEIPIFFTLVIRVQQQICSCYGYDPKEDAERAFMLNALSFASPFVVGGKAQLLFEINALKIAIKRNTYKQLNEMGGKYAIPILVKKFASDQGKNLSKKKMMQAIPILGATFGGFFNYMYIHRVVTTTANLYKKRFLEDKSDLLSVKKEVAGLVYEVEQ